MSSNPILCRWPLKEVFYVSQIFQRCFQVLVLLFHVKVVFEIFRIWYYIPFVFFLDGVFFFLLDGVSVVGGYDALDAPFPKRWNIRHVHDCFNLHESEVPGCLPGGDHIGLKPFSSLCDVIVIRRAFPSYFLTASFSGFGEPFGARMTKPLNSFVW
jgi:hypothetical protein